MSNRRLSIGVDIGGTFTDFVLADRDAGTFVVEKVLTTPDDPSQAVLKGFTELLESQAIDARQIDAIIHGTTLATNAIIERQGAHTALVTTKGFRDVLEIRREKRFDIHDLEIDLPAPLVPRALRFEVDERVAADGTVVVELDEDSVHEVAADLVAASVESVAIVLLNSFVNDTHERRVAELLHDRIPGLFLSLSSQINPEIREYERTSTTVVNAYVQPLMKRYLEKIETELRDFEYEKPLYMMLSDGGVATASVAAQEPVRVIESGPAGGAVAAAFVGGLAGFEDLVAFDMGGTTAKICLVERSEPTRSNESEVARLEWFQRGSGFPVRAPGIEMIEIGTGGGSLARVGSAGLLRVGPRSAGAAPGPACYRRGGTSPTVTDADVVLGYLDPEYFLGGRMRLDRAAAEEAIDEYVAGPLGLSAAEGAWAVHELANEQMATSARLHVIQRGRDPREYVMCAFGGAGPGHAVRLADRLGMSRVLFPQAAGVASALGFLAAPLSIGVTRGYATLLNNLDEGRLETLFAEMKSQVSELLTQAGIELDDIEFSHYAALCYDGQGYEIETLLQEDPQETLDLAAIEEAFNARYAQLYGRAEPTLDVKALTWRTVGTGPRPTVTVTNRRNGGGSVKGVRHAYHPEVGGYVECTVYDRYALGEGVVVHGPAIIEEAESTVILPPAFSATVTAGNSLLAYANNVSA